MFSKQSKSRIAAALIHGGVICLFWDIILDKAVRRQVLVPIFRQHICVKFCQKVHKKTGSRQEKAGLGLVGVPALAVQTLSRLIRF